MCTTIVRGRDFLCCRQAVRSVEHCDEQSVLPNECRYSPAASISVRTRKRRATGWDHQERSHLVKNMKANSPLALGLLALYIPVSEAYVSSLPLRRSPAAALAAVPSFSPLEVRAGTTSSPPEERHLGLFLAPPWCVDRTRATQADDVIPPLCTDFQPASAAVCRRRRAPAWGCRRMGGQPRRHDDRCRGPDAGARVA